MTTSDIKNAADSAIKSTNDIKIESVAAKSELPTTVAVTKMEEVKTKAPVKVARKAVVKKAAATPVQAPASSTKKLPVKTTPKPIAKAPSKPLTKALAKAPAKAEAQQPAKPIAKVLAEKASKQKKPKLVRDSFTIPKAEYSVLDDLKQRAIKIGNPAKKSELLRAGIKALASMTDAAFKSALIAVPTIKTGRPAKD